MIGMRKFLCVLTAVMLATFALPSFGAPQFMKLYALTMTSSSPLHVTATLTNVSPDGNSTIGSFQYTISGGKIGSATLTAQDPRKVGSVVVNGTGTSVFVSG